MNVGELIDLGLEIEVAEKLKSFWLSLPRDKCAICDSKASEVDEFWDYYVDGNRGITRLMSLRSLCSSCHLAKHIGYANATGRLGEALEQLAKVNNLTPLDVYKLLEKRSRGKGKTLLDYKSR
jgi:hypothetical protein